ncbi:hypothetical protein [Ancylobacter sp. SL191]|uniref:hypothetical protein n=1 Tax=Ancylobacter sp. SL191 TaxID=2995166 RepID=UPI0022716D44|nr:hypothetical protein [Ancylobacter sp. SL191]WAC28311.1 hypothetical protein OU996_04410 [Ancylobacter sp. SL191]
MLFRVTLDLHQIGDILYPGNFAEPYLQFRPGGPYPPEPWFTNLLIEIALESARKAARPDAPSRLHSIFSCETIDEVRIFKNKYRENNGYIFGIEPENNNISTFRGNSTAISTPVGPTPYIEYTSDWARDYWTKEPDGMVEVLIGGPARVISGPL